MPAPAARYRFIAAATVALLAVAVGLWLSRVPRAASPRYSTAPLAWTLPSLQGPGTTVSLAQFRGRPTVAIFFASWCTACKGELPELRALWPSVRPAVNFVGIDSEESGNGLAMAEKFGITVWPLALDVNGIGGSGLHDAVGGQGMPITVIYDSSGRIQKLLIGATSAAELRAQLQRLGDI